MYDKGYQKQDILNLYSFIDWVIQLPEPLAIEYNNEVLKFEEEQNMAYITTAERLGFQRGREEGRQEGREEGELLLLKRQLASKFGKVPTHYTAKLQKANADELLIMGERILAARTIEDVFI